MKILKNIQFMLKKTFYYLYKSAINEKFWFAPHSLHNRVFFSYVMLAIYYGEHIFYYKSF